MYHLVPTPESFKIIVYATVFIELINYDLYKRIPKTI
jgi:hypothetical protein